MPVVLKRTSLTWIKAKCKLLDDFETEKFVAQIGLLEHYLKFFQKCSACLLAFSDELRVFSGNPIIFAHRRNISNDRRSHKQYAVYTFIHTSESPF